MWNKYHYYTDLPTIRVEPVQQKIKLPSPNQQKRKFDESTAVALN